MTRPNLQTFARSASESRYPQLWRGLIGAWAPCLGPTGSTLRDWSGRANHGTLTNFTLANAWVASDGRFALSFDGAGYVNLGSLALEHVRTFSVWVKIAATAAASRSIVCNYDSGGTLAGYFLAVTASNEIVYAIDGTNFRTWTTSALSAGWHHVTAIDYNTGTVSGAKIFVDGVDQSLTNAGTDVTLPVAGVGNASIGRAGDFNGLYFTSHFDDLLIYNRDLSFPAIWQLSRRRGIAYEMRERRAVRSVQGTAVPVFYRHLQTQGIA